MKQILFLLAGLLFLSGCFPVSLYYREGAPVERMKRDETTCAVNALKAAPVANQIRRIPPRFVPGRRVCDASGKCTTYGGYWVPGEVYTVDVNANLRRAVEQQCMADRGYRPIELPQCPQSVAQAAPARVTRVLPPLGVKPCVIRYDGGRFLIVNRG